MSGYSGCGNPSSARPQRASPPVLLGAFLAAGMLALSLLLGAAAAQPITMLVGADEGLDYPANMTLLPDEHTTFLSAINPVARASLVFASSNVAAGASGGTVVLQPLSDTHFVAAHGYQPQVFTPPLPFTQCDPEYDAEFDENYAAPGSVLQDPTRPPGNLIMIYEAENHCPGNTFQFPYYATIGLARSADDGKTWPAPIATELGGKDRHVILKIATAEPDTGPNPAMGDAIPTALIAGNHLYVVYRDVPAPNTNPNDGLLRMARATLDPDPTEVEPHLHFRKWYVSAAHPAGAFSEPGIGGQDTGILGPCPGYQAQADLSWNEYPKSYLLVFVCASVPNQTAAWYFSTATSLDRQDWTPPQQIANSRFPLYEAPTSPPEPACASGAAFDGWYPSLITPPGGTGLTGASGYVYFLNGCDGNGTRAFTRRSFRITR